MKKQNFQPDRFYNNQINEHIMFFKFFHNIALCFIHTFSNNSLTPRKKPMNKKKNECYFCQREATTEEHIPPKSFFRAIPFNDKYLIKVPSCPLHNNEKKADDEFFRNVFSMHSQTNDYGLALFKEKTLKSFRDSPSKFNKFISVISPDHFGILRPAKKMVDYEKIQSYFNYMACGLYFYIFKEKYKGIFSVIPLSFITYSDERKTLELMDQTLSKEIERFGEYQNVFYYQLLKENNEFVGFKLVFMEGIKFLVYTSEFNSLVLSPNY